MWQDRKRALYAQRTENYTYQAMPGSGISFYEIFGFYKTQLNKDLYDHPKGHLASAAGPTIRWNLNGKNQNIAEH